MNSNLDLLRRQQAERLELVRKNANLKQNEFAAYLDIEPGSYSDIKRCKNGISRSILDKLEKKLNINLNWLLHNEGPMLREDAVPNTPMASEYAVPYNRLPDAGVSAYIEKLFKIIEKKDEQIDRHLETIKKMNEQIEQLIAMKKEKQS